MYIEIDGWRSNLRFSACHFIPEYAGAPRVHGYTYTVNVRIHGKPDKSGIIIDFEQVKAKLNSIIESFDHKIIMPRKNIVREDESNIYFEVEQKSYSFPRSEVITVDISVPSAEELSRIILEELKSQFEFPENVIKIELGLDESWGQGAWSTWDIK
ncbi:MAG: 6-carboxytetrahydropterin synthase [Thermoplasmata archaeon]|nr:MAG: 6-carboxytetrahydropterin synthase [Thermoplasmata archaeon]